MQAMLHGSLKSLATSVVPCQMGMGNCAGTNFATSSLGPWLTCPWPAAALRRRA